MSRAQRLLLISRIGFSLSWLLVGLQISLQRGIFVFLPLFTLTLGTKTQPVGAILIVPLITGLTALAGWRLMPAPRPWRWGNPTVTVPVIALGLLALARSWPAHRIGVLVTSALCIILFWSSYIYTLQNWPAAWTATVFAILAVLHGTIALLQFAQQNAVGLRFLGEITPLDPRIHGVSVVEVAGQRWLRAYGLLPHPNSLGGLMGLSLLICLGALLQNPHHRRWFWAAIAMASVGLFLSFSRSAWLGTMLGLLYLAGVTRLWQRIPWREKRVRWALVGTLLVLALIGAAFGRFLSTRLWHLDSLLETNSIQERLRDIGQAWMLIRHQPLTGVGTGYYVDALWAWANATGRQFPAFQKVHNVPLLLAAEMGIVAPALWFWLVLTPPFALARQARKLPANPMRAAWSAALLLWCTVGLLDFYPYILSFRSAAILGALCGIWASDRDTSPGAYP